MGSLFKSPKAPTPIDVGKVAGEQTAQNTATAYQQAAFNRINQSGPFGSVSYQQTGTDAQGNPTFSQSTTIDPNEMAYRGQQRDTAFGGYSGGLGALGSAVSNANVPTLDVNLQRVSSDPEGLMSAGAGRLLQYGNSSGPSSQGAFDNAYRTASANIEPRFEQSRAATENRLRNQGLDPTSEAYKSSMNDLALQQNESRNDLTTKLQGQMFNQDMASRQQGFNEGSSLFSTGANRASQLFGQDQGINNANLSGFQAGTGAAGALGSLGRSGMVDAATSPGVSSYNNVNVGNVDLTSLYGQNYNQQQQQYQADMNSRNSMLGGLGSIGGTLLGLPMGGGMSLGGSLANRYFR